jgi:hypothetical protein
MANEKLTKGVATLQNDLQELQAAGAFSKVEKAEKLVTTVTALMGDLVGEINAVRDDLDDLKTNGFR